MRGEHDTAVPSGLEAFGSEADRGHDGRARRERSGLRRHAPRAGAVVVAVLAGVGWWRWAPAPPAEAPAQGVLRIESDPDGAEVTVDGAVRGFAPVAVIVTPGTHRLIVRRGDVSRQASVTVPTGGRVIDHTTWIAVPPAPVDTAEPSAETLAPVAAVAPVRQAVTVGWVRPVSPVPLQIYEGGRLLGTSESGQVALSPGMHTLQFVSDPLGFRIDRAVSIAAGGVASVGIEVPRAPLAINALPWADVWIDGTHVGQTPLGDLLEPIGVHHIEFRHPQLATKQATVTVSLKTTARLSVDMRVP